MHIFKQYYGVRQYFFIYRFVSLRKRQAVIEQTRFLGTVFLCSEFRLEYCGFFFRVLLKLISCNIYSGVNFCGENLCDNFYFRELNFCGSLKKKKTGKIAKIRTRKNFMPHGSRKTAKITFFYFSLATRPRSARHSFAPFQKPL